MQKFKSFLQPTVIPVCPAWSSNKAPSMMSESCHRVANLCYTHILASDSRPSPRSLSAVCLLHVQSACTNLNSVTWSQAPSLISEAWYIFKLKCERWPLADSCQAYNSNWSHCWSDGGRWNCRETINRFTVWRMHGECFVGSIGWVPGLSPGSARRPFDTSLACSPGVGVVPGFLWRLGQWMDPLDWTRCLWDVGIGASSLDPTVHRASVLENRWICIYSGIWKLVSPLQNLKKCESFYQNKRDHTKCMLFFN